MSLISDCCGASVDGLEGAAEMGICPACREHCEFVILQESAQQPQTLTLVLHRVWFDQMLAGHKNIEYRAVTPYWTVRLSNLERRGPITTAVFLCGYSRQRLVRKVLKIDVGPCPYKGWTGDFYRIHLAPIEAEHRG